MPCTAQWTPRSAPAPRWPVLIGIGIIGALLAAPLGLVDFWRLRRGDPVFRVATVHMVLNTFVLVFWGASFSLRFLGKFADSSTWTVVSDIVLLAILGVSGFLGGSLSYRYGVRVATEAAQREGFDPRRDSPRPDPRDHKHRT